MRRFAGLRSEQVIGEGSLSSRANPSAPRSLLRCDNPGRGSSRWSAREPEARRRPTGTERRRPIEFSVFVRVGRRSANT